MRGLVGEDAIPTKPRICGRISDDEKEFSAASLSEIERRRHLDYQQNREFGPSDAVSAQQYVCELAPMHVSEPAPSVRKRYVIALPYP